MLKTMNTLTLNACTQKRPNNIKIKLKALCFAISKFALSMRNKLASGALNKYYTPWYEKRLCHPKPCAQELGGGTLASLTLHHRKVELETFTKWGYLHDTVYDNMLEIS
jgi:hypothetical protein